MTNTTNSASARQWPLLLVRHAAPQQPTLKASCSWAGGPACGSSTAVMTPSREERVPRVSRQAREPGAARQARSSHPASRSRQARWCAAPRLELDAGSRPSLIRYGCYCPLRRQHPGRQARAWPPGRRRPSVRVEPQLLTPAAPVSPRAPGPTSISATDLRQQHYGLSPARQYTHAGKVRFRRRALLASAWPSPASG